MQSDAGRGDAAAEKAPTVKHEPTKAKSAHGRKKTVTLEFYPPYVIAGIVAVIVLGYVLLNKDASAPPVPQNTELIGSDTTTQRIASIENFLQAHPTDKTSLLAFANMLHDARLYPRAIAAYGKYLAIEAKDPDARVDMAICYFESGDAVSSLNELTKALEYSPKHQPAMFNMGIVYLNQEKVKESNDWFSRCAAIDPTSSVGARAKQLLSQHSLTNKNLQ